MRPALSVRAGGARTDLWLEILIARGGQVADRAAACDQTSHDVEAAATA